MSFFSLVKIGTICVLVGLTAGEESGGCSSLNICDGIIVNGINISFSSFEGINDTLIDINQQMELVELDGTEVERKRHCLSLCHYSRLSSPDTFCKRVSLEAYSPIRKSKCYYDTTSYYSIQKKNRQSIYKYEAGWTTFYIKNVFCEKDLCKDPDSYCEANFTAGNGSCVCTGEFQGKFCDTWDFKKRLDNLWRFEKTGLTDEIGGKIGKSSSTAKMNRAIQRKSKVLYLKEENNDYFEPGFGICLQKAALENQCPTGFTLMFWIRGITRKSHDRVLQLTQKAPVTTSGMTIEEKSGSGILFKFQTKSVLHRCTLMNPFNDFYRKWQFFAISFNHTADQFFAMRNSKQIHCTKADQSALIGASDSKFVSKYGDKFIDDIMYVEQSSDFEMMQRYYEATKL